MPAVSAAQRRFIYGVKGKAFAKAHHFDNPGPLPERAGSAKGRKTMAGYGSSDVKESTLPHRAGGAMHGHHKGKAKKKGHKGGHKKGGHKMHGHSKPDGFGGLKMC